MNNLIPSFLEGSPLFQFLVIAVVGVVGFGLTFVALRAFVLRQNSSPINIDETNPTANDPFTFGSRTDRRASHRRLGNQLSVWIADKEDGQLDARIHDRSMGGIGITANREILPGTIIKVRPNNGLPTAPWVEVEVKSCLPQNGEWQIGCSFVKTPPYSVILMFG